MKTDNPDRSIGIGEYFDYLEERSDFLIQLNDQARQSEALLLTCCYIESIGNALYGPHHGKQKNFVHAILDYGNEPRLSVVFPWQLCESLQRLDRSWARNVRVWVESVIESEEFDLDQAQEFISRAPDELSRSDIQLLNGQIWRGTVASFAYERVRSELVHNYELIPVTLGRYRVQGEKIGEVGFDLLFPVLQRLVSAMRKVSINRNRLFGHDYVYESVDDANT